MTPIRAFTNLMPRMTIPIVRCDDSVVPRTKSAVAKLPLAALVANVVVPVERKLGETTLVQETAPFWDRHLVRQQNLGSPAFFSSVLLSSRNRWRFGDVESEIYDRAIVIDGAKRLESACKLGAPKEIPITIIAGLTEDAELSLRKRIIDVKAFRTHVTTLERIGTDTPRLIVDEQWITLEIQSEPFVVPTKLGYSAALLVRRLKATHLEHMFIGAKSLASEMELLRTRRGALTGAQVSIRKQSKQRTAPYVVRSSEELTE